MKRSEMKRKTSALTLNQKLMQNDLKLYAFLEKHFLMENQEFDLHFPVTILPKIEQIFDQIIFKNGIGTSCINYIFTNTQNSSISKVG
jgi:hypothetical protein